MRPVALITLLAACVTGPAPLDADDVQDTAPEPASACESSLELAFPDGTRSPLPCVTSSVETTMEFDPDDPPEIRTLQVAINSSDSAGFECNLSFSIRGVCGAQSYWIGERVTLSVASWDCTGTPDAFEGALTAQSGFIDLGVIETTDRTGNLTGESVPVRVRGSVQLQLDDGARLEGAFDVAADVVGEDAEEQECAAAEPVEVALITGGELTGAWVSGANDRNYHYDLQLGGGITPVTCPRCDFAGNMRYANLQGVPPVDQSGDVFAVGLRSGTGEAFIQDPASEVWTLWGVGEANGTTWYGQRTGEVGGRAVAEEMVLTW